MLRHHLLGTSIFTATALLGQIASAEITAADVWANMTAYEAALGGQTIGTETVDGDTLTITDRAILFRFPFEFGTARMTAPDTTLTTNADGSVSISYPDTFEQAFEIAIPSEDITVTGTFAMNQRDLQASASGTPGDVTYNYSASAISFALLNVDTSDFEGSLTMQASGAGYTLIENVKVGDLLTSTSELTIAPMEILTMMGDPSGAASNTTANYGESVSTTRLDLPVGGIDVMNISAALQEGFSLRGTSTNESMVQENVEISDGDIFMQNNIATGANSTNFSFDADGLALDFTGADFDVAVVLNDLFPLPITATIADVSAAFAFPLLPSEDPKDFNYSFGISDLAVSDELWTLIVNTGDLPRDPISMAVDLSGTVINGIDFLNFNTIEDQMDQDLPPISLESLTVNEVSAVAVGASAIASGAFILDNTDLDSFDGFPRPEGSAILKVEGANTLLDRLVDAGLLGNEEATAARFGMAFIGRSTGDDAFESQLDVNADGHVSVNGQRMR